jgi:hypothetical protein
MQHIHDESLTQGQAHALAIADAEVVALSERLQAAEHRADQLRRLFVLENEQAKVGLAAVQSNIA